MRVLVFSSLYPNGVMPQFGIFVHRRVEALSRRGVALRVVAPVPFFPRGLPFERWRAFGEVPARERLGKIHVTHPRYPHLPGPGMYFQARSLAHAALPHLRALRAEFDFQVIDAHYVYPDGVAAVRLARTLGVPCVITGRGSDINVLPRHEFVRRQIVGALQRADAVVAVSGALAESMRGLGAPANRMHVIPNGIDREVFHYGDPVEARRKLCIYSDERMLLSVGNLNELKGHALVIEAVGRLRARGLRLSYHIVGSGPEEPRLRAQIDALGLQDRVHLQGSIANERLRPWYQAASLFVLASSREGWPNVLNESLSCGAPVVATKVGGVPEIIRHGDNGLLTERSPEAIADAIETALARSWDRQALAAAATRTSWSDVAARLAGLFDSVVEPSASTRAVAATPPLEDAGVLTDPSPSPAPSVPGTSV
jgi:glycosyltransferase involved in cell wall biosynthesis